jgi:hypothetical protein
VRVFDRIEIAFCTEWGRSETVKRAIDELQDTNRQMTNEKTNSFPFSRTCRPRFFCWTTIEVSSRRTKPPRN